jgi:endoglucanase
MRIWTGPLTFALFLTILSLDAAQPRADELRRGLNIHHAMNWAKLSSPTATTYLYPAFADDGHRLDMSELQAIRSAGFDFVRLTVDPGPFLQFKGAQRDELDDVLLDRVRMALAQDLSVIVDFHPNEQNETYAPRKLVADAHATLFVEYRDMVSRTARALSGLHDKRIWLEPMNEPQIGWNTEDDRRWQVMLGAIYRDIRAAAPHLGLVLTGGSGGSLEGLLALDATPFAADPRATFTFHYYYPYAFTHQSFGARQFLNGIPYPAHPDSLPQSLQGLAERINHSSLAQEQRSSMLRESERALRDYFGSGFDRAAIRKSFDQVTEWAGRYSIGAARILLGEFGVVRTYRGYRGARDEDRTRWLRDVREQAENRGYGWAIWVYRGEGGMAIFDESGSQSGFDKATLAALGLLPAPSVAAPHEPSCQAKADLPSAC